MADDDWQDWQPPPAAAASQTAAADDGWTDWQPPPQAAAGADDGWTDWQDTRDSKPPTPEDWKNLKPDQINKVPESRGIKERATAGFKEGYKPLIGESSSWLKGKEPSAVEQIAPEFSKEHPIIAGVLQNVISGSPIGWADRAQAALFGGAPGGVAGVVAGAAEPFIGRSQADKLQSDTKTLIDMGLVAPGLGWAGAAAHGRMGQLADVGKEGLKELKRQGQTPGPTSAPGVAQDPNPPARSAVADFQNKATLGDGQMEKGGENLNTRDYGKTTPAATGEATGVNVLKDGVDPTLAHTFKAEEPPAAARPPEVPPPEALPAAAPPVRPQAAVESAAPRLLPEKQPFYDAALAASPNLSHEQLLHVANLAGGPKGAALMARNFARRIAEDAGAPAARVAEAERAPVPAETMELPPVEVRPPGMEVPPKAAEAIATSKAAEAKPLKPGSPEAQAAIETFNAKPEPAQPLRPGSPEAQAAIETFNAKPEPVEAAPVAPPDVRPVEQVGGTTGARLLQRGFSTEEVGRMTPARAQEILAGDYTPQEARARGIVQRAPQELPGGISPPKVTPEARPIEPTGRPVPEGARAEINTRLDQTMSAADPAVHLRETAARARELGLEGQARSIESAAAELERQRTVEVAPGPGERSTGTLRQQQEGIIQSIRDFIKDEGGGVKVPASIARTAETIRKGYDSLLDWGREGVEDIQMKYTPMAANSASARARVVTKDRANTMRRIDQEWSIADDHIKKHFDEASRKEMWERADEENVMRQTGEQDPNKGIAMLNPKQRALVESFQPKARELWQMALDIGWAHGDPLPYYTPRMFEGIVQQVEGAFALDAKGRNIQTTTPGMKQRKHLTTEQSEAAAQEHFGAEAKVVRDIRTMPMALAKMEKALVDRIMIKKIEEMGRRAGETTVIEGNKPNEPGWFTLPENPAFYTFRPRYEIADTPTYRAAAEARSGVAVPEARIPLLDRNGNPVIDRVPIHLPGEFKGPLKAIMSEPSGPWYSGFMALKGKTMGLIMNSPAIHNMVEWGRAFPTMPGKMATLQVYFEGNAAKRGVPYNGTVRYVRDWMSGKLEEAPRNASPQMIEAIDHGMVPIGKRFFNQDISAIMETPDLTPGRSLTAKTLALIPDLFNPKAGDWVKQKIDRAGDVWHNTLLWDRIADLQMGLYVNAKRSLIDKGTDPKTAQYVAAHIANRYAGALPNEAMSAGARKAANFLMFSRTFTLGNLGVLKDMFTGLPKDVQAQIMRDMGTVDPSATGYAQSLARRKAMSAVALDIGLMYIGNSVLQSVFNLINSDENLDKALGTEGAGYVRRFKDAMERLKEDNPMVLLNPVTAPVTYAAHAVKSIAEGKRPSLPESPISAPGKLLGTIESLSATYENEPGKYGRIKTGETKEGRGVYMRLPIGKLGEEYIGIGSEPIEIAKRKLGTIAGPLLKVIANDKGFGEKIYESKTDLLAGKQIETATEIAKLFFLAQTPEGQLKAAKDLITGQGNKGVNILQAVGPVGGFTFSQGHPGGPAAGELAAYREHRQFEMKPQITEIRKLVQDGKTDEAIERMNALDLDKSTRQYLMNPRISPRQMKDLFRHGMPEQVERFERKR